MLFISGHNIILVNICVADDVIIHLDAVFPLLTGTWLNKCVANNGVMNSHGYRKIYDTSVY